MEDTQQYIESGILEQYVLGELSAAEQTDVERWAARYPAVREELDALEAGLGVYAEAYALTPPAAMRERVLAGVFAQIGQPASAQPTTTEAAPSFAAPVAAPAAAEMPTMRVSASNPHLATTAPVAEAAPRRSSFWAIAASVALLLSLAGNFLLYGRWQRSQNDLVALQSDQARVASATQVLERKYASSQQQLHVFRSPDQYRLVALAGTKGFPQAHARVLFDKADHRVYLDVQQLPALPAGKQYQLWALNNGKPVDAGMLLASTATGSEVQQMKDIASAQAFAMTVEPAGGSVNPTLSTMTVMGAI